MEHSVYETVGGSEALTRLAAAWHHRCLEDEVVAHAFAGPGLHPQHVERLATYWGEALGGPAGYTAGMGDHSHVLRLHAGNGEHAEMDWHGLQCFALALDDAGVPGDPELRRTLMDWFAWMTAAMSAYPGSPDDVPDDAPLPVWSWNGPPDPP
jgi:hemoglobin